MKLLNKFSDKNQENAVISGGRSMVEMLGVLAIIGVLSVGAIAGYSKAMMKYKLNKQNEQITQLMSGLIEYKSVFSSLLREESVIPLLVKLNIVPKEMIKSNNSVRLYDIFNLPVSIRKGSVNDRMYFLYLFSDFSDNNHELCRNIMETFKGYEAELYAIGINSTTADDVNQQQWYYGKTAPLANQKTRGIYQLNISLIDDMCSRCDKHSCGVYAVFL